MTIGLIGEGVTDQITVSNVLIGYTEDKNLAINELQPLPGESGNWDKVFKYCKSENFKQAFTHNQFVVIQLDTDFLRGDSVPAEYRVGNINDLQPAEIVAVVKEMLVACIDNDFYQRFKDQIIFAIAVDQTECWYLGIYFPGEPKKASKHINCIETLNTVLPNKEGFYIDGKDEKHYRKICKHFRKKKDLLQHCRHNDSFRMFIEELESKLTTKQKLNWTLVLSQQEKRPKAPLI